MPSRFDAMRDSGVTRRAFMARAGAFTLAFGALRSAARAGTGRWSQTRVSSDFGYGPLVADPDKIMDLPEGFSYTIVSRSGQTMDDGLILPGAPDGMAAFPGPDGRVIVVRNHEIGIEPTKIGPFGKDHELLARVARDRIYDAGRAGVPCLGGTSTFVYDVRGQRLERQFMSLAGTSRNCAGGPTPWGSWLSCEESVFVPDAWYTRAHGYVFEVPASATQELAAPSPIKAMGRFNHEAVAVNPRSGAVYMTEDRSNGLLYRYLPFEPGHLHAGGRLQALRVRGRESLDTRNWTDRTVNVGEPMAADWMDMQDIDAPLDDLRERGFKAGATCFSRGEGMWLGRDGVYFACTDGGPVRCGQIWRYAPAEASVEGTPAEREAPGTIELFVESTDPGVIQNADNITAAPWGDLVVCEDGLAEQFLLGITPKGNVYKLGRNAKSKSELAGACFSPDGSTLFVNIQTDGLTLAITGPWRVG